MLRQALLSLGGLARPCSSEALRANTQLREFASKAKQAKQAAAAAAAAQAAAEAPDLRLVMRQLAFLVHPDRFADSPQVAQENSDSLALLQGLLSTVQKAKDRHPPAGVKRLRFHLRDGDSMKLVDVSLKTTGGDCRHVVERSLVELFKQCGLPSQFRWGKGDWDVLEEEEGDDSRGGDKAASQEQPLAQARGGEAGPSPRAAAAACGEPPRPRAKEPPRSFEEALRELDPMLKAIAGVPWTPNTPEGASWRNHVALMMATLQELDGWKIKRSVEHIWAGASEAEVLASAIGLDSGTREMVKTILFHVRQIEKEQGPPPGRPPRPQADSAQAAAAAALEAESEGDDAVQGSGSVSEVLITSEGDDDEAEGAEEDGRGDLLGAGEGAGGRAAETASSSGGAGAHSPEATTTLEKGDVDGAEAAAARGGPRVQQRATAAAAAEAAAEGRPATPP